MNKGDTVKALRTDVNYYIRKGRLYEISSDSACGCCTYIRDKRGRERLIPKASFELKKKGKEMSNTVRYFRQKKDTFATKKGTIWVMQPEYKTYKALSNTVLNDTVIAYRYEYIQDQPKWFEEVFPILPEYATKEEALKLRKLIRGK